MSEIIIVYTTISSEKDARQLSRKLLGKRLIACAQIDRPVTSLYWWKGNIEECQEYRLVMKSSQEVWTKLEAAIKNLHPYEIPEIVVTVVSACGEDYKKWIEKEVG